MNPELLNLNTAMKNLLHLGLWLLGIGHLALPARAEIPEPDNIIYGRIQLGGTVVTANQTNVIIEARKTSTNGPVVASYRMGDSFVAGDFFSLNIPIEAFNPLTDTNASRVGGLIYLSVRDNSGVRVRRTTSIASRGKLARVDFVELDTDGDGLPDSWEQQYFGNSTNGIVSGDQDGDGRNNLTEYIDGTNPLVADGRHPADNSPANNFMTFTEAEDYASAWLLGARWPNAPTNIPIAYVTRAALLALNGGTYVFTNAPPTNAPHWWVNVPRLSALVPARTNFAVADMPESTAASAPLTVTITVTPAAGVLAHAVDDQVPTGWEVLGVSHGGVFDATNSRVKWGPFYDDGLRDLSYDIIPAGANSLATFNGTASFDGFNVPITGNRTIAINSGGLPLRWTASLVDAQGPAFLLSGESSSTYVIEVSTNLTLWVPLQTITTDGAGQRLFRPTNPGAAPHRFYRTRNP